MEICSKIEDIIQVSHLISMRCDGRFYHACFRVELIFVSVSIGKLSFLSALAITRSLKHITEHNCTVEHCVICRSVVTCSHEWALRPQLVLFRVLRTPSNDEILFLAGILFKKTALRDKTACHQVILFFNEYLKIMQLSISCKVDYLSCAAPFHLLPVEAIGIGACTSNPSTTMTSVPGERLSGNKTASYFKPQLSYSFKALSCLREQRTLRETIELNKPSFSSTPFSSKNWMRKTLNK